MLPQKETAHCLTEPPQEHNEPTTEPVEKHTILKEPVLASMPEAVNAGTDDLLGEKAVKLVKPCPASGGGVHRWVFYAACRLIKAGLSDEQAETEIEALMTRPPD